MRLYAVFPTAFLPTAVLLTVGLALAPRAGGAEDTPSIKVSPAEVHLRLGEGKQLKAELKGVKLVKDVKGTLKWTVEGAGLGTVTQTGFYQAPTYGQTPGTVRVRATSVDFPGVSEEIIVFLDSVSLAVQPTKVELETAQTCQFKAKVEGVGDQRVIWSVEGGPQNGQISESGLFTAPATFATPGTITVKAAAAADPSKTMTATVYVGEVGIELKPKESTLKHGRSQRFGATVRGTANTAVEYSVLGDGLGSVSSSGLYTTAPVMTTPAEVTIVARSVADPSKKAVSRIRVEPIAVTDELERQGPERRTALMKIASGLYRLAAPTVVRVLLPYDPVDLIVRGPNFKGKSGKQYVPLGGVAILQASVTNSTNDRVLWAIEGQKIGQITEDGIYRAPDALQTPQVIQIRATSVADPTKSKLFTLHIPPIVVQGDEEPEDCMLGGAVQLKAKAENTEDDRIVWSVEGGEKCGSISETGLYQPPSSMTTPTVVRVRAASAADPTKSAVFQIRIAEAALEVSPGNTEVKPGQSVRLKTKVKGTAGSADVTWKLTPEIGFISPDGVYQAPETGGPQVVQVTALLKGDPTKTATALIRLREK